MASLPASAHDHGVRDPTTELERGRGDSDTQQLPPAIEEISQFVSASVDRATGEHGSDTGDDDDMDGTDQPVTREALLEQAFAAAAFGEHATLQELARAAARQWSVTVCMRCVHGRIGTRVTLSLRLRVQVCCNAQQSSSAQVDLLACSSTFPWHGALQAASDGATVNRDSCGAASHGAVGPASAAASAAAPADLYSSVDAFGTTLLMEACKQKGHIATVKLLLSHGSASTVQARDASGRTALHYAAGAGDADVVAELLRAGADATAKDQRGATPLHFSTDDAVAKLLIDRSADAGALDASGRPALSWLSHFKSAASRRTPHDSLSHGAEGHAPAAAPAASARAAAGAASGVPSLSSGEAASGV